MGARGSAGEQEGETKGTRLGDQMGGMGQGGREFPKGSLDTLLLFQCSETPDSWEVFNSHSLVASDTARSIYPPHMYVGSYIHLCTNFRKM